MGAAVLVAGIGNELMGDDGLGVEVARILQKSMLPSGVTVLALGNSILSCLDDLAQAHTVVVVDAMKGGQVPGTVYSAVLQYPFPASFSFSGTWRDSHGMTVLDVIMLSRAMTGRPARVLVYGMEPASLEPHVGLTQTIAESCEVLARRILKNLKEMTLTP